MSVRGSFIATVASRAYLAVVALAMVPIYTRQLGLEGYGLVALFMALQVWFQLLDLGLTPTMAREASRYRAGATPAADFRLLLRAMEGAFVAMSLVVGAALLLGADRIAMAWLKLEHVSTEEATFCLRVMGVCIALRLISELYRGVLAGMDRLVWLAGFGALSGTVRMVLVVPCLAWLGATPTVFFGFQLVALAIEATLLAAMTYRRLPRNVAGLTPWRPHVLRQVMGFSLAVSLASVVWVTLSQLDKLLLSGLLSMSAFGAFSLVAAAASGVLLISNSLADVLSPRFARLQAQGAHAEMLDLYRQATQWAGLAVWPLAGLMAFHAERLLWAWTGDAVLAAQGANTLSLYALGNAALAIAAFPYYWQFAAGELKLHLIGTVLMVTLLVPIMIAATLRFGAVGAGGAWLAVNLLYLLAWTPVVHARYMPGAHGRWLSRDVLPVACLCAAATAAGHWLPWPSDRLGTGLTAAALVCAAMACGAAGSPFARSALRRHSGALHPR